MSLRRPGNLAIVLALFAVTAASADQTLSDAYAAILKGDYVTGRSVLEDLADRKNADPHISRARAWLGDFEKVRVSREELRQATYDWNVEQSSKALADGNVFVALSFAAQASAYVADEEKFPKEPWVRKLRERGLSTAREMVNDEKWRKAHSYYSLLQRLDEHDEEIRELRERAARHARLAVIYGDGEDVERRVLEVNYELLKNAIKLIDENYYREPDFRKMANGALDSVVALCQTSKLYDGPKAAKVFDGVADPASREHFMSSISELRKGVWEEKSFGHRDLIRLFRNVNAISKGSVEIPDALLIIEFLEGALSKLDEFTSIVWPADASEFDKMMIGEFRGVGIQLGVDDEFNTGRLKVVTPLENSPSLRAGIQPGDLIIKVDGVSTKNWTTDEAVRKITGMEGSEVVLTMVRPSAGWKEMDFRLTRSTIHLTTIRGVNRLESETGDDWNFMLDKDAGIAYIRLTGFNPESQVELSKALEAAQAQGMRGLIFDVRHNPGGLLDVAIETVSTFLKQGDVVSTIGRMEARQRLKATGKANYSELPLVVLVNEGSASASEILAGALQDHDRAVVLGDRTFGKGSVQRVLSLNRQLSLKRQPPPQARLKLTTALYYLPSGRSPHKESPEAEAWGVDPDWAVKLTPKEFGKVIERERSAFIIHNEEEAAEGLSEEEVDAIIASLKNDEDEVDVESRLLTDDDFKLLRSDPYEAEDIDPQLEKALLHLRIKLAADLPWPRQLVRKE